MKVIHYLNQFYGQAGGESMADMPLKVLDCPVGPGLAINQALNSFNSKIISTIICGDNYFSEHMKETSLQIKEILREKQPDLVIAGPAFNAGRYGIACGEILKAANELHIDAISAMNEENPGVQLYKTYGYIIPSAPTARGMKNAVTGIANLAEKIAKGQKIEGPDKEGYFPRGIRKNIFYEKTGAVRAIDMLLAKINGQPYQTELPTPVFSKSFSKSGNQRYEKRSNRPGHFRRRSPHRESGSPGVSCRHKIRLLLCGRLWRRRYVKM